MFKLEGRFEYGAVSGEGTANSFPLNEHSYHGFPIDRKTVVGFAEETFRQPASGRRIKALERFVYRLR